jgi:hypothetical protein
LVPRLKVLLLAPPPPPAAPLWACIQILINACKCVVQRCITSPRTADRASAARALGDSEAACLEAQLRVSELQEELDQLKAAHRVAAAVVPSPPAAGVPVDTPIQGGTGEEAFVVHGHEVGPPASAHGVGWGTGALNVVSTDGRALWTVLVVNILCVSSSCMLTNVIATSIIFCLRFPRGPQ